MSSRAVFIRYHEGNSVCPGRLQGLGKVDPHLVVSIIEVNELSKVFSKALEVIAAHCNEGVSVLHISSLNQVAWEFWSSPPVQLLQIEDL